jgi:DNA-directed RNA polymerase specialized sigma24 family protein
VLDEAMDKLSEEDNIAAELIKLRLFGGLTVKQAAEVLQISLSKAYSDIEYAHAWLRLAVGDGDTTSDS